MESLEGAITRRILSEELMESAKFGVNRLNSLKLDMSHLMVKFTNPSSYAVVFGEYHATLTT